LCCLFRAPGATPLCPLSLHDALPILTLGRVHASRKLVIRNPAWTGDRRRARASPGAVVCGVLAAPIRGAVARQRHPREVRGRPRSEEHTSELQSPCNLVCRLLLEKKK